MHAYCFVCSVTKAYIVHDLFLCPKQLYVLSISFAENMRRYALRKWMTFATSQIIPIPEQRQDHVHSCTIGEYIAQNLQNRL